MPNAVIYARYSSSAQRDVSIDDQVAACNDYAAQQGYTVLQIYADRAISGTTDQRPEFQHMISDAKKKTFEAVIVYKQDRFARNRYDAVNYKKQLQDSGVHVESAMEPVPEGPGGILLEALYESMAQQYSENLAQNTLRGMSSNAQKGLANHQPPFGYKIDPVTRKYVLDPVLAPLITEVFIRAAAGQTTAELSAYLTQYGIQKSASTLYNILHNEAYAGVYKWKDTRIDGGMPALVDRATWEQVQEVRRKRRKAPRQNPYRYLLTGKVHCGVCGSPMNGEYAVGKTGARYYYYNCRKHKRGECSMKPVRAEHLERTVCTAIVQRIYDNAMVEQIVADAMNIQLREQDANTLSLLEGKIKDAVKRRDNLIHALEMGITSATTQKRLTELETAITELTEQLEKEKIKSPAISAEDLRAYILSFRGGNIDDPDYATTLIRSFCQAVEVAAGRCYIVFDPLHKSQEFELLTNWWPRRDSNPRPFGS